MGRPSLPEWEHAQPTRITLPPAVKRQATAHAAKNYGNLSAMICALIKKELAGKMGEPAAIVALKERLKNLEITLAKIRRERGDWEAQASEMRNQAAEMREQAAAMREHAAEFRAIAATVRVQAESIRVNPVPQKTHEFRDSTDEIIEQSLAERRKQNKTITPKKDA